MTFVPPSWIVKCDTCTTQMDICASRPDGRKYEVEVDGERTYRCVSCQDATGVQPVYDERYATKEDA